MEVVGRFGTDKEAENLQISVKTPVWLPVNDKELNDTLNSRMINVFYGTLNKTMTD